MKKTKSISISRTSTLLVLLLIVFTTLIGSLFQPEKAKAADIDDLPDYLNSTYDQYISREPDVNGKGNFTPSFRFILYSPNPGASSSIRVTRGGIAPNQTAPPRCEDFNIDHNRLAVDNAQSGQIALGNGNSLDNSCVNTPYGFRLENINRYAPSARFPGYVGTVIKLEIRNVPRGSSTFADIETLGGNDRLSYVGDNSSSIPDSANGVSMSLPQDSGNTILTKFAPPCNSNVNTAYVWWKDADSGQDTNGDNIVYVELREFKNGYANGYKTLARKNAGYGPGHDSIPFTPQAGAKYELRFSPVRSRSASHAANTIKAWVPFDSAAAFVKCPGPQEPPPCQGSWSYNVSNNSVYKYSFFDRQPAVTNPSPVDKSSGASRVWANTSGATNLKTDYHNSNDGNYITSLPNEIQYLGGYVLVERWHDYDSNGNGSRDRMEYGRTHAVLPICSTAACVNPVSIRNVIPGSNNGVQAGQNFEIELDIYGTNLPGYLNSQPLSIIIDNANTSGEWHGAIVPLTEGLGTANFPNTNRTGSVTLYMPNDLVARGVNMYIGYPNLYSGRVSALCGTSVNPYHRFNITPNAFEPVMDDEDPRTISYTTGGNNTGATVTLGWERQLLRKRGGASSTLDGVHTAASTFGNYAESHSIGTAGVPLVPGTLLAGDQVCSRVSFGITDGWVGPSNHIAPDPSPKGPPSNPIERCRTVSDRPYLRVYGADVIAGSEFAVGDVCNNTNSSEIRTFFSNHADRSGSGAQFAALAMGQITQFSSASLRASPPTPMNGLSFANTGSPGFYDGANICASDFYGETQYDDPTKKDTRSGSTLPLASLNTAPNDGKQTLAQHASGQVTLLGMTGFDNKHTIFVDGDLSINDNIEYAPFSDATDAPALAVIVRGNIYINKNVSRLDGMYVAQKKADGSGGTIYTCSDGFNAYSSSGDVALLANCSSKLTVNGAFVANYVSFLRTINSLRDSEVNNLELTGNTDAAEVFNFTPEMYLSAPPFREECPQCRYKSFETLPPIL